MKIYPLEAELFLADRRTDMTKLTADFSGFAKAFKYFNVCTVLKDKCPLLFTII
jgi:hypothetical protein